MPPGSSSGIYCCGKGGNVGRKFIIDRAIQMLADQGHVRKPPNPPFASLSAPLSASSSHHILCCPHARWQSGKRDEIMIVGDRFDTDVRGIYIYVCARHQVRACSYSAY